MDHSINLPARAGTNRNVNEIITALRSILRGRQVSALDDSLVMTETAETISFSEKMLKDLDTPPAR